MDLQMIAVRELWKSLVRFSLIPVGDGCDIVHEREVSAAALPSEGLNLDTQVALEADGVGDVPAVHAKALLRLVQAVRANDLRQAGIGSGKFFVLLLLTILEIIRPAEVVFGAG